MTTENNLDYINEYIALDEPDGTRAITKLVTAEQQSGYKDMTDKEISKLISYHANQAEKRKSLDMQEQANIEQMQTLQKSLEEQTKLIDSFFQKIISTTPMFKSVTGNEVE